MSAYILTQASKVYDNLLYLNKQSRDEYTNKILHERYPNDATKTTLNADEMSEFYKEFLDRNWASHIQYNIEWQKRNFTIIFLSILVGIENLVKRK